MAVIDLLNLQPTTITRDLRGKYVEVYSEPGVGKTTFATQVPGNIILGFEHGWNAKSGIFAVDVPTWADFKAFLKQFKKPEMKAKFQTITIDTISIAWDRCTDYICTREGIDKISDMAYGQGYKEVEKEFEKTIISMTQMGYGIIFIAHAQVRTETDPEVENATINILGPSLPNKPYNIINRLVDIVAFANIDKDGSRWLNYRRTPTYFAKTRFTYMPDRTPLNYEEFVTALTNAIQEEENHGSVVVDKDDSPAVAPKASFEDTMADIKACAVALHNAEKMAQYNKIVAEYLGKGKNVKDCTEEQIDIMLLILDDLKDYIAENKIPME